MTSLPTPLTNHLDLDVPVVQAPIGSATCPDLAAAVSNAGGLGMLAITWRDADETLAVLRETARQTNRPFGVNIVLDDTAKTVSTDTHLDICATEEIDVVSFSFGDASPYIDTVHDFGATVVQSVGSAAEARAAVDAGVDIIVAQGWESGGHVQSDVATLPLIPRVVDVVPDTPVIAAGGIGDGRGIAAALTLGAAGVWLDTRFVATREANVHEHYRERITDAAETDTLYSTLFDEGWPDAPHRVLENETTEDWQAAGEPAQDRPGMGEEIVETSTGEPIRRYEDSLALPGMTGEIDALPLYAGQSAGVIDSLPSAATLVEELVAETQDALDRAATLRPEWH